MQSHVSVRQGMLAEGQLYFALSRAPSMESLQVVDCRKTQSAAIIQARTLPLSDIKVLQSSTQPTCHSPGWRALSAWYTHVCR